MSLRAVGRVLLAALLLVGGAYAWSWALLAWSF
jgi:hypothetical protein